MLTSWVHASCRGKEWRGELLRAKIESTHRAQHRLYSILEYGTRYVRIWIPALFYHANENVIDFLYGHRRLYIYHCNIIFGILNKTWSSNNNAKQCLSADSSGILLHHFIVPSSSSSAFFSASFCPFWAKLPFPLLRFSLFVAQLQFFRCFFRIVDDVCMIMGQHQQQLQAQQHAWTKLYPVLIY